jgi:peptide/nickel transport system permease protein
VLNYLLQRLATLVPTLFFVSVLIFAGTELLPGDVAQAILDVLSAKESAE